jgi:uncharacterized Ntn-hydrolase superfamily protein
MRMLPALSILSAGCAAAVDPESGTAPAARWADPPTSTFSIVGFDPVTGDLGVAVESKFFGVGAVVPFAKAGVGAVATQSWANTTYGPRGLALLEAGATAEDAVRILLASDEHRDQRQLGIIDAKGKAANATGAKCNAFAGHKVGTNYAVQGNILTGQEVVDGMAAAFEKADGELADKLLAALEAGQKAGGDKRGQQSAALLVVRKDGGYSGYNDRLYDLRVDDHAKPIEELRRLLEVHRATFLRRGK